MPILEAGVPGRLKPNAKPSLTLLSKMACAIADVYRHNGDPWTVYGARERRQGGLEKR